MLIAGTTELRRTPPVLRVDGALSDKPEVVLRRGLPKLADAGLIAPYMTSKPMVEPVRLLPARMVMVLSEETLVVACL